MAQADFTYGCRIPTDAEAQAIISSLNAWMAEYRKTDAYRPAGWRQNPALIKKYEAKCPAAERVD